MLGPMRSLASRLAFGVFAVSVTGAGCSGLLGLDDFEAGAGTGGGAASSSDSSSSVGPGSSGSSTGASPTSSSSSSGAGPSSSSGAADGGGGNATSDGGGGNASTSDGGGGSSNDGGGGSSNDGGGGNATTSDGGGGSTSSDGGGGGVVDPGPTVVISSASVANNQTTASSHAIFGFASDPAGSAVSFQCRLDGGAFFFDCTGGFDQSLLAGGTHTLEITGTNAAGTTGPILTRRWTIEAMGTTILALRQHTIADDTLVQISTNVRAMAFITNGSQQNIFVQDLGGNLTQVQNHGIRTIPRNAEANMAAGLALTVVGTFRGASGSDQLLAAEYTRGAQLAAYSTPFSNDTEELVNEALESVVIRFAGEVPTDFNCSGGCDMTPPAKCMEGCGDCVPMNYLDFTSTGTFDWGFYEGVLVGGVGEPRFYWFFDSSEGGDDICL